MKILFIGPTRIGDTILSTSIINYYLEKYDNCNFTIITSPFANNLYMKMPRLAEILVVNKKKFGMRRRQVSKLVSPNRLIRGGGGGPPGADPGAVFFLDLQNKEFNHFPFAKCLPAVDGIN